MHFAHCGCRGVAVGVDTGRIAGGPPILVAPSAHTLESASYLIDGADVSAVVVLDWINTVGHGVPVSRNKHDYDSSQTSEQEVKRLRHDDEAAVAFGAFTGVDGPDLA